jgi:N-acetyl-anhydromuramyl-L-alanine amidase AmpD
VQDFTPPPQSARIVVRETSVVEADQDIAPTPQPQGFFSRLFGTGKSYRYLTSSVRRAIDRAPVKRGRWRYIVVHNSGTRQGSASAFEHYHRNVRRMVNGLAYHFVIGNGTSTKDGAIEIGNRWHRQIQGGHVHSDYLNNIAIGICLVGDFNHSTPRPGQLASLEELIDYLRSTVGKIQGQRATVRAHREINPPQWPTDCPGDDFPYSWLHRKF